MVTRTYKREDGSIFEVEQSIADDILTECPETGQSCQRVIEGGQAAHVDSGNPYWKTSYKEKMHYGY